MKFNRRTFVGAAGAALATTLASGQTRAADKVVRVGFQKYGTLVLLKAKGALEQKLEPLGYKVTWTEFPSGPPLLEALNVGAIDFGTAGETPPIFAQAADAPFLYVGHEPPAPKGEAILVAKDSPVRTVADLKGRKVALNKGSNVHYLLVRALENAGIAYSDIQTTFLAPADARAAFVRGDVEAWVIWDPYQAAAEVATGARTLTDGTGIVANHQFYLAAQRFTAESPQVIDAILAAVNDIDRWAKDDTKTVAAQLSPSIGIPAPILEIALSRQSYGVKPLDNAVVAEQQRIADTFFKLGLLPKAIDVARIVRRTGA
jgi:sulfonate transport system substrate-binding protein